MAWNQNIPQPGDKLSQSQADLRANFQALDTYVQVDHVALAAANQGKHNRVFFVQQGADIATPNPTDAVLYTKAGTGGGNSLFYRADTNQTPVEFSFAAKAAAGYTILPSGIYMQWGTGMGNAQQNFAIAFPTACLNVVVTETGNGGTFRHFMKVDLTSITAAHFTAYSLTAGSGAQDASPYNYLAIGY